MRNSIILLLAVLSSCVFLKAQIIHMDDATALSIDAKIVSQFSSNQLTGLSVGIIYGGELVFAKGYGVRNDDVDPFTPYTKSLLASISKTITGVLAMKLVENGDIALDDPIEDYVEGYAGMGITVRHLLAHQSGIDHYNTCPSGYSGSFSPGASNALVQDCSRCMIPSGSATLYTTQGSTLLGVLIHNVGVENYSKTFIQLYNDWIKTPANIVTLVPAYDNSDPALAEGFEEDGDHIGGYFNDIGWKLPAGGFISNVEDLARFAIGVMDNTFLNSTTTATMFTDQTEAGNSTFLCNGPDGNNFGLSFRVSGSGTNLRAWHNGLNSHGYSSLMYLYPNQKAGIVLLCNNYQQTDVLDAIRQDVQNDILCPQNRDFMTTIDWFTPTTYEADQEINCSTEVLANGGGQEFILDAGTHISLTPGFLVTSGKVFQTALTGCGGAVLPY